MNQKEWEEAVHNEDEIEQGVRLQDGVWGRIEYVG